MTDHPTVDNSGLGDSPPASASENDADNWTLWWFFGPLVTGGVLTALVGAPDTWKSHAPRSWVATLALTAAMYFALSKWQGKLEAAGPLKALTGAAERATPTFVLGCAIVGSVETAYVHGWSPLLLVGGAFSLLISVLLIVQAGRSVVSRLIPRAMAAIWSRLTSRRLVPPAAPTSAGGETHAREDHAEQVAPPRTPDSENTHRG